MPGMVLAAGNGKHGLSPARRGDSDSVVVPAVVPVLLGHVRPCTANPLCQQDACVSSGISPAAPSAFPAAVSVEDGTVSQGQPPLAGCTHARKELQSHQGGAAQPGPERTQICPRAPNLTWLSPKLLLLGALVVQLIPTWLKITLGAVSPHHSQALLSKGLLCPSSPAGMAQAPVVPSLPHVLTSQPVSLPQGSHELVCAGWS